MRVVTGRSVTSRSVPAAAAGSGSPGRAGPRVSSGRLRAVADRLEERAAAVGAGLIAGRDQVGEGVVHALQVTDPRRQVGAAALGQRARRSQLSGPPVSSWSSSSTSSRVNPSSWARLMNRSSSTASADSRGSRPLSGAARPAARAARSSAASRCSPRPGWPVRWFACPHREPWTQLRSQAHACGSKSR